MSLFDRPAIFLLVAAGIAFFYASVGLKQESKQWGWILFWPLGCVLLIFAVGHVAQKELGNRQLAHITRDLQAAGKRQNFQLVSVDTGNYTAMLRLPSGCKPEVYLYLVGDRWATSPPDPTENCPNLK